MDLALHRRWRPDYALLIAALNMFDYAPGEDRATGYLYAEGEQAWPDDLEPFGPALLDDLDVLLGVRFTIVAFQAYRNGTGCGWHADAPFDVHAVLSLGVARTFGVRELGGDPTWIRVEHGDLVVMPSGFQAGHEHCVPVEDVEGERVSLVFRTVAEG